MPNTYTQVVEYTPHFDGLMLRLEEAGTEKLAQENELLALLEDDDNPPRFTWNRPPVHPKQATSIALALQAHADQRAAYEDEHFVVTPLDKPEDYDPDSTYDGWAVYADNNDQPAYIPPITLDADAKAWLEEYGELLDPEEPATSAPLPIPVAPHEHQLVPGFIISPDRAYDTHTGRTWDLMASDWYIEAGCRCIDIPDDGDVKQTITLRIPFSLRDPQPEATQDTDGAVLEPGDTSRVRPRANHLRGNRPLYPMHVIAEKRNPRWDNVSWVRQYVTTDIDAYLTKRDRDNEQKLARRISFLRSGTRAAREQKRKTLRAAGVRYGHQYYPHHVKPRYMPRVTFIKRHIAVHKKLNTTVLVSRRNDPTYSVCIYLGNGKVGYMKPATARQHYELVAA